MLELFAASEMARRLIDNSLEFDGSATRKTKKRVRRRSLRSMPPQRRYAARRTAGAIAECVAATGFTTTHVLGSGDSRLAIEREPERGIEVERRALVPGFLPGLLAKGRAGIVEVSSERDHCGRVESSGFAERERGPREARRPVGVAARGCHLGEAPDRMAPSHRAPSLRAIAAASSKHENACSRSPSSSSTQPRFTSAKPVPRVSSMSRASSSDSSSLLRAAAVFPSRRASSARFESQRAESEKSPTPRHRRYASSISSIAVAVSPSWTIRSPWFPVTSPRSQRSPRRGRG